MHLKPSPLAPNSPIPVAQPIPALCQPPEPSNQLEQTFFTPRRCTHFGASSLIARPYITQDLRDQLLSAFTINAEEVTAQENDQIEWADAKQYDVIVIGGTPAGVAAAIAAGRAEKSVIIIEQSPILGGVLSSGMLRLDDYYVESNSGVIEEYRQRVSKYHRTKLADDPLVKEHLKQNPRLMWNTADGRAWEPHTAAGIFAEMVTEQHSITTRFSEVAMDVKLEGKRVTGVITWDRDNKGNLGAQHAYRGKVIIDATNESDLAAYAEVPFRIRREARSAEKPHAG